MHFLLVNPQIASASGWQRQLNGNQRMWVLSQEFLMTNDRKCLFSKTKCSFTDSEANIATQDPEKPDGWFSLNY
jgi:hypothetical protein